MSEDVWAAEDTTPDEIESALRELLRKRRAADHAVAPARVLNLIVVVDGEWKDEISKRLQRVGRYHASRTVLCSVQEGRTTLDAIATIDLDGNSAGGVHAVRERVEIDLGPEHLSHLDTIVDPVLVNELPNVLWSPYGYEEAVDALLPMIDVILLDSDEPHTGAGLGRAAELRESAYVVDLAWLRTTPWRERLAASFDPPHRRQALGRLTDICVRHRPSSPASAALLAGWLAARLHWSAGALQDDADGAARRASAEVSEASREVEIVLAAQDQEAPGLAGVTVAWEGGCSLSLDRGGGGLTARQRDRHGHELSWRVLGASRGEGLILGEGVRQALLRDPTYGPALESAMVLTGAAER